MEFPLATREEEKKRFAARRLGFKGVIKRLLAFRKVSKLPNKSFSEKY